MRKTEVIKPINKLRSKILITTLSIFLLLVTGCPWQNKKTEEYPLLTIIHTNDIHGIVDGMGGLAQVATAIKKYKEEHPNENVLVVDAGDINKKSVFDEMSCGAIMYEIMETAGYNFLTFGNHELNYGYTKVKRNLGILNKAVLLNSNIKVKDTNETLAEPYKIIEANNFKIGFFSVVISSKKLYNYRDLEKLVIEDHTLIAQETVEKLKAKDVDVIIAIVHLGFYGESQSNQIEISEFLDIQGIDLVIDGHSHTTYSCQKRNEECENFYIVRNEGHLMDGIGLVKIWNTNKQFIFTIERISKEELNGGNSVTLNTGLQDEEVMGIYNHYAKKYYRVIGNNTSHIEAKEARKKESQLANTVADSYRYYGDCDLALVPGGNLKEDLVTGDISIMAIYKIIAETRNWNQEENIVKINLTGKEIKKVLNKSISKQKKGDYNFLQVSGIQINYDTKRKKSKRITSILIDGKKMEMNRSYSVALPLSLIRDKKAYATLRKAEIETYIGLDYLLVSNYIEKFGLTEQEKRIVKK